MGMSFLLDTHVLIWWLLDDPKLSSDAKNVIANSKHHIFVSSVSACEISIKHKLGKLPHLGDLKDKLPQYVRKARFEILPISLEHGLLAGNLATKHKDAFDRMLIAQAQIEDLTIISNDKIFKNYKIPIIF